VVPQSAASDHNGLKRLTLLVFLAGVYNLCWGAIALAMPGRMLAWYGVEYIQNVAFWQCIGMLVGAYGVGYVLASRNLHQLWPVVFVGLIGKVLGPIGTFLGIASGDLPVRFLWVNATNDLIWLPGFIWALVYVRRTQDPTTATAHASELTLYQRVLGARFHELLPQLRQFHSARQRIEVNGSFDITRGPSPIGNWFTDLSGFPRSAQQLPVSLRVTPEPAGETWHRVFGQHIIVSWQQQRHGLFAERFGPLWMYLEADVRDGALIVRDLRSTFLGVPLPPALSPQVDAFGRDEGDDIFVRIQITNPILRLLLTYSGKIRIALESPAVNRSAVEPAMVD